MQLEQFLMAEFQMGPHRQHGGAADGFLQRVKPGEALRVVTGRNGPAVLLGQQHLFGDRLIAVGCQVAILQGVRDADVPFQHAEKLVSRLASDDVVLTLVKDGDHRLSRPEDLALMTGAVARMVADFDAAARVSEAPQ